MAFGSKYILLVMVNLIGVRAFGKFPNSKNPWAELRLFFIQTDE